jgi:hypothetical protein
MWMNYKLKFKFKTWWFNLTHVKCNYCQKPVSVYYDAYLFNISIQDYKGDKICIDCINKLPNRKDIIVTHDVLAIITKIESKNNLQ